MSKIFIQLLFFIKFVYYEILDSLVDFFRLQGIKFTLEEVGFIEGGHNKKFIVKDIKGKKWVVKFCRNTINKTPDSCEREELTFLIGRLLGLPFEYTKVLNSKSVRALIDFCLNRDISSNKNNQQNKEDDLYPIIEDKFVLINFIEGDNLKNLKNKNNGLSIKLLRDKNFQDIINAITFYHWIGEEDRGLTDVLIDRDNKMYFIDHGLSGPGYNIDERLRSNHPFFTDYNEDSIIKMCYPIKDSFVEFIIDSLEISFDDLRKSKMVKKIKFIPKFILKNYVYRFDLKDPQGNDFRGKYLKVIIKRQKELEGSYNKWVSKLKDIITQEKDE